MVHRTKNLLILSLITVLSLILAIFSLFERDNGNWKLYEGYSDPIAFAHNVLWMIAAATIGIFYLIRQKEACGETRLLMLGIGLVGLGTAIHRLWYTIFRLLRSIEPDSITAEFQLDFAWLLAVPIAIALFGYAFHIKPLLFALFGDKWYLVFIFATTTAWSLCVTIARFICTC